MATRHFSNDRIEIFHSTKADGDFQTYAALTPTTLLYPAGNAIAHSDGSEKVVHAQGIIIQKPVPGHAWAIPAADCLPLIFTNETTGAIGLLHLGWEEIYWGTARTFLKRWFNKVAETGNATRVFIGPHICSTCFTLRGFKGWLRIALFSLSRARKHLIWSESGYSFDLVAAALEQLQRAGIPERNISISPECTFENTSLASCRREKRARRHANFFTVRTK